MARIPNKRPGHFLNAWVFGDTLLIQLITMTTLALTFSLPLPFFFFSLNTHGLTATRLSIYLRASAMCLGISDGKRSGGLQDHTSGLNLAPLPPQAMSAVWFFYSFQRNYKKKKKKMYREAVYWGKSSRVME